MSGASPDLTPARGATAEEEDVAAIYEERDWNRGPPRVAERIDAVQAELAQLQAHPWAGEYYEGDGLGANIRLSLAPGAGVAATWAGCLGLYGANEGFVSTQPDGSLAFAYNQPNKDGFGGFPDRVVPVRWGERRYLIRDAAMLDFVNAVNLGDEPRVQAQGMFLLADGDELKPVDGPPDLPAAYVERVRAAPLQVGILLVEFLGESESAGARYCEKRYRLALDRGLRDGIAPGTTLKTVAPEGAWERVRVTTAEALTAVGEATIFESDCADPRHVPDLDWRLTTGAFDPVAANRQLDEAIARQGK